MLGAASLVGGLVSGVGSLISGGKAKKAAGNHLNQLSQQLQSMLREGRISHQQYQQEMNALMSQIGENPNLDLQNLDMSGARDMYSSLVGEAESRGQSLIDSTREYGQGIIDTQQKSATEAMGRMQTRAALASGGRMTGEEIARDAARQASADLNARAVNVGGGQANILQAINRGVASERQQQNQLSVGFNQQRVANKRAAMMGLNQQQMMNQQQELAVAQNVAGMNIGALQQANSMYMGAAGAQAGAEGQFTMAENQSMNQNAQTMFGAEMGLLDRRLGLGQNLANQNLANATSLMQMQMGYQNQMNNVRAQRDSISPIGNMLGALGSGVMAADKASDGQLWGNIFG